MSPLYQRRNELAEIGRQEQEGAAFWTASFSTETRNRLELIMRGGAGRNDYPVLDEARTLLLYDLGRLSLYPGSQAPEVEFYRYLAECPDDMVPSVVEAYGNGFVNIFRRNEEMRAFSEVRVPERNSGTIDAVYAQKVNRVLVEDRIAFDYIGGEMVPFSSRELHVEVVQPILRLLTAPGWESVEKAYQDALTELAQGKGANAITDAGTALQEAFSVLGATGNQLGDLITSAKSHKIIASHDEPLLRTMEKACKWVAADRSVTGDTHNAVPASIDDAWFTVHVVGAIILRLASAGSPRQQ